MKENSSSDDDVGSAEKSSKKLKLNDGSSQDSIKNPAASSSKDENMDSGVPADKSDSTSNEDRAGGSSAGPSNEVVTIAPSGSNVQSILLNIRRPERARNYRKRKTPDRDSDTPSSRDSDDLSVGETQPSRVSTSETDSDSGVHRFRDVGSAESVASSTISSSPNTYESDYIQSDDSISHNPALGGIRIDRAEMSMFETKKPLVLRKEQPKHNYIIVREVINRELGLTFPYDKTTKENVMFERRFYGSLHAIYRMRKLHSLNKHRGCVNSISFHPEGRLLVSGSDDTNLVLWDWARNRALQTVRTGHKSNVFQSKFLYLNARSQLNIATCARDGQVRLIQVPPSGGPGERRRLCTHSRAAHKLHVSPHEQHVIISAGEDGLCMQADVRQDHATRLFQVKDESMPVPLYSVHGHPLKPRELVVAGRDKYIRMYDRRKPQRPVASYYPNLLDRSMRSTKSQMSLFHLTCAVYNHDGTEILGSYNDEDIYLFDTKRHARDPADALVDPLFIPPSTDIKDTGYAYRYSGHRNSATFKGVTFFGPHSEYIVSGSDCSYIYVWHKLKESIVQWMKGDASGVVNCVEVHPQYPVLATCGLDRDVKIWMPRSPKDPTFEGLEKTVEENRKRDLYSPVFNDFLPTLYSAFHNNRLRDPRLFSNEDDDDAGNYEFDGNACATM